MVRLDMKKGELRVRHTLSRIGGELVLTEPKTERVEAAVPLHSCVMAELKSWRAHQLQERLAAGDQWTNTGALFATELGTFIDPHDLLRTWNWPRRRPGLRTWVPTVCETAQAVGGVRWSV